MGGWKTFGEWARAVRAADAGGEPDPRLGPPLPEAAPLTAGEVAQVVALATAVDPDREGGG